MAFLVFVVRRCGKVEIAHHVAGGLLGIGVGARFAQVRGQPLQQAQHAVHTLVAGFEHLEGFLETGAGAGVQRHGGSHSPSL